MNYNTDGNLAALNAYQREQDALDEANRILEEAQQELADDLFDAYMSNNYSVIDEVDDSLTDTDTMDDLIKQLRDNWTTDCMALRTAYMKVIGGTCEGIAGRCETLDEIEGFRRDFDL